MAKRTKKFPTERVDPVQRYGVPESAAFLRQSEARTWLDIKENKLKVIREGKRTFVPGSELIRRSTLPAQSSDQSAA